MGTNADALRKLRLCEELLESVIRLLSQKAEKDESDIKSTPISFWTESSVFTDSEECQQCGYNIQSREMRTPHCPWCGKFMLNWDPDFDVEIESVTGDEDNDIPDIPDIDPIFKPTS